MGRRKNKRKKENYDSYDDFNDIRSRGRSKKHKKKAQRHFDKSALRGIMDGTINVDAYQDYVDDEQ